ncbi:MAG: hypothetical protein R2910_12900 [Gemmatimonadales bacterium]
MTPPTLLRPLLLALLLWACSERPVRWNIESAPIIYTRRDGGAPHLHRLDPTTGATSPLVADSAPSWNPSPSPDGTRLAYLSRRDGNYEIYVWGISDSGVGRNITNDADYDVLPAWSPDGRQLAFMSTRGFELGSIGPFPGQIYIANLDDGTLRQVTTEPLTSSLGPGSWSPDGRYLTLSREVDGQLDLFLLNLTDSTERQITHAPESEYSVEFSHDGQWVAFHAESDSSSQIVVARIDGTDRRVVTQGPGFRYTPHWSPDDAWLLYSASGPDGNGYDLRAVRVGDGQEISLLATPADETEGVWLQPEAR